MIIIADISYMHRKSEAKLLPLDTEIERTLRNLKKVTEEANMAEQRNDDHNMQVATIARPQQRQRTLEDF